MPLKLRDSVVAITGASSGIGRATAKRFARRGAAVVVTARREEPLVELVRDIEAAGGQAMAVPADVTDEAAVRSVADRAVERFGRLDVWVNNAAVSMFASFEEAPPELYRRVVDVNYFGYVNGARAAFPHFRRAGSGVLVNNASVLGHVGAPYVTSYVSAKWAILGWSESLRQELRGSGIKVCVVSPGSIDTPLFQRAANFTGRTVKALPPVIDVERVARAIVLLARLPRREAIVGVSGRQQALMHRAMPRMTERLVGRQVDRAHFEDEPAEPTAGAVMDPIPSPPTESGGWKDHSAGKRVAVAGLLAAAAGLAATRGDGLRDKAHIRRLPFAR